MTQTHYIVIHLRGLFILDFFFLLELSMSHLPQGRVWGEEGEDWSQKVLDLVSGGLAPGT